MPRLFSGLEIPDEVSERLSLAYGGMPHARWVERENHHITLRFIGDVDGATAAAFSEALTKVSCPAFDLTIYGLGSFGHKKPRAVWAGVAACASLIALQYAHERAALAAGLPPETRKFIPHVTLARLRGVKTATVARWLEGNGALFVPPFPVTRFVLFSARESTGGGPYIVEDAFPLTLNCRDGASTAAG